MTISILEFLKRVDLELSELAEPGQRMDMYHLGRSALVLHFGFPYATNDVDFVSIRESRLQEQTLERFGPQTEAAKALGMYIHAVPPALPSLLAGFEKRSTEVEGDWCVLRLWKLDPHDLAASKLKRFHAGDREDLQTLCDRELLDPRCLRALLQNAFQFSLPEKDDDDDPSRVTAFRNLERVEAYIRGELPPNTSL